MSLEKAPDDSTTVQGFTVWAATGSDHWSWASGSSVMDAQVFGTATAEVAVCENLGYHATGNYNPASGMISSRDLASTFDVDAVKLVYTPTDNPLGMARVEVVQKTCCKVRAKYVSNGADDQTKYFYWRLVFTDVKQQINESIFQWQLSTVTSSGSGANVSLKFNGEVGVGASWSQAVEQGVNEFECLSETRWENRLVVEFDAAGGKQTRQLNVDAGFHWDLHTNDANTAEFIQDVSKLNGSADYCTVVGFGRITIIKNTDGTAANAAFHPGTDTGNPELVDDRSFLANVTYVRP